MIKRTVVYIAGIFVLSLLAATAFGADPGTLKNFSADMETTSAKGSFTSEVSFKDGRMRVEHTKPRKFINIRRPDKKVVWILNVDRKTYMEIPLDMSKEDIQSELRNPNIKTKKEFIANEVVDKHPAKKYHLTIIRNGKREKSGYIWEATDLNNFVVEYQSEDKKTMIIWKNIKSGDVSDSLFELPAGYKKVDMPAVPGMSGSRLRQLQ